MKIIFLFIISCSLMSAININLWSDFGYMPNETIFQSDGIDSYYDRQERLSIEFGLMATISDFVYIGGRMNVPTKVIKWEPGEMWPEQLDSEFIVGFRYGPLSIGYSHLCEHPVRPYQNIILPTSDYSTDKFFLRVELDMKFKNKTYSENK